MKNVRTLVGLLTLTAGAATMLWFEGHRSTRGDAGVDAEASEPGLSPIVQVARDPAVPSPGRNPVASADEGLTPSLTVRVSTAEGYPIAGARLFAAPITLEEMELDPPWPARGWDVSGDAPPIGTTNNEGLHVLKDPPWILSRLVLWATHVDHEAGIAVLGSDRDAWPSEVLIVLAPAAPIEIVVQDRNGSPVSGAWVQQYASLAEDMESKPGAEGKAWARGKLRASASTGIDGIARMSPFPGRQAFVASLGNELSTPWQGITPTRVVLTLRPTFEVGGQVSLPEVGDAGRISRCITIDAQDRNLWRKLHTIRAVETGPWGPVVLPRLEVDRYRVRLEGSGLVPLEELVDPPPAGARLTLDLAPTIGVPVVFRVADDKDEVIPGAMVKVKWQEPGRPDHWNFAERHGDGSGRIGVSSIPPGAMMYEAHARGYVPYYSGLEPTSASEGSFTRINLEPAGRLVGRCTRSGVPLQDFEILVWQEVGTTPQSQSFLDCEDGRFELETVPSGTFYVTASTADHPGGVPMSVSCPVGGTAEVDIDLPESLIGFGLVVDDRTQEPITDAAIQVFVPASPYPIARWGLPIPVQADGTFELATFLPGPNPVRVVAPGYSSRIATQTASGGEVDFGTIGLSPSQPLHLILEREDPSIDVEVSGRGSFSLESRVFEPDGAMVYENVDAGGYVLRFDQGNYEYTLVEVNLVAGEDWRIRERIDGPRHLTVECQLPNGRPYPDRFQARAEYLSSQGLRHQRKTLSDQGVARFRGIDAERVSVIVEDWDGNEIGAGGGAFSKDDLHVVVPIGEDPFDLRVVDADGHPLSAVRVMLLDPAHPGLTVFGRTAEDGSCRLSGVPTHEVLVHLQHSTGCRLGVPVDASTRTTELVLDPSARIEAVFRDGDLPLDGVACTVIDETRAALTPLAFSDAEGRATISALAPGRYPVLASRSDCWTLEATVEAAEEPRTSALQMRRLADLSLQVVTAKGIPVVGVPVELESVEFETSVSQWVAEERVPSTRLETDAQGLLLVERIPRGAYRWSLEIQGERLHGQVTAAPEPAPPSRIVLPE